MINQWPCRFGTEIQSDHPHFSKNTLVSSNMAGNYPNLVRWSSQLETGHLHGRFRSQPWLIIHDYPILSPLNPMKIPWKSHSPAAHLRYSRSPGHWTQIGRPWPLCWRRSSPRCHGRCVALCCTVKWEIMSIYIYMYIYILGCSQP